MGTCEYKKTIKHTDPMPIDKFIYFLEYIGYENIVWIENEDGYGYEYEYEYHYTNGPIDITLTNDKILLWDFYGADSYMRGDDNYTIGCTYYTCGNIDLMHYLILRYAYERYDQNDIFKSTKKPHLDFI